MISGSFLVIVQIPWLCRGKNALNCYFWPSSAFSDFRELLITIWRSNWLYINGHFKTFKNSLSLILKVFRLYFLLKSPFFSLKILLRYFALFIALLIPSKELGLINPAASPIRKADFSPQQKLKNDDGLKTRHASVLIGSPNLKPSFWSFIFWFSNLCRALSFG